MTDCARHEVRVQAALLRVPADLPHSIREPLRAEELIIVLRQSVAAETRRPWRTSANTTPTSTRLMFTNSALYSYSREPSASATSRPV